MADWSRAENEATVASYFAMLEAGLRGEAVNKTEFRNELSPILNSRSKGAVEYKYQNISAVLIDLGVPYISGYKPAVNYQADLREVVFTQLTHCRVLREVIAQSVELVPEVWQAPDPGEVFAEIPKPLPERRARTRRAGDRPPMDYLRIEAHNRALGLAGEMFVLDLERARLERVGKSRLAAQVSHISAERGDGFGYDILSFEESSKEKLIEVKTTKYGEYTPFFVTSNELAVSKESAAHYHLFRVYQFGSSSRVFRKAGALDEGFDLRPANYLVRVGE